MTKTLERLARKRSRSRCEYCRMPEDISLCEFQVDHIIPQKHGGQTVIENLALACVYCNSHKGPNLADYAPITRRVVRLFHPRKERCAKLFAWDGPILTGETSIGRVTIAVPNINDSESIELRELLIEEDRFP